MKKILYFMMAVFALFTGASCTSEMEEVSAPVTDNNLKISIDVADIASQATRGLKIYWEEGDKIFIRFSDDEYMNPELVMTYTDNQWIYSNVDPTVLKASGTMRAWYESSNSMDTQLEENAKEWCLSNTYEEYPEQIISWYFPSRTIVPLVVFAQGSYEYYSSSKMLKGNIQTSDWTFLTKGQLVVKNLPEGKSAEDYSVAISVEGYIYPYIDIYSGFNAAGKVSGAGSAWLGAMPNKDGAAFYFDTYAMLQLEGKAATIYLFDGEEVLTYKTVMICNAASPLNAFIVDYSKFKAPNVQFEDETFRAYCLGNFDEDKDGIISPEEAAKVTEIDCSRKDITSLKGIEIFTALETLDCSLNHISSLDVSKNTALKKLICTLNSLTNLDVSQNTALTMLICTVNYISSLDVSKNTALKVLGCGENQLTSLDLSQNIALEELYCFDCGLTSLDVSKNTALKEMYCSENQMTSLDLSQNTLLRYLDTGQNPNLTEIIIAEGQTIDYFSHDDGVTITEKQ